MDTVSFLSLLFLDKIVNVGFSFPTAAVVVVEEVTLSGLVLVLDGVVDVFTVESTSAFFSASSSSTSFVCFTFSFSFPLLRLSPSFRLQSFSLFLVEEEEEGFLFAVAFVTRASISTSTVTSDRIEFNTTA